MHALAGDRSNDNIHRRHKQNYAAVYAEPEKNYFFRPVVGIYNTKVTHCQCNYTEAGADNAPCGKRADIGAVIFFTRHVFSPFSNQKSISSVSSAFS
jgi:hypothetical protein